MQTAYGFAEGTPGVRHEDVAHLLIPGRNRSPDGLDLSVASAQRVDAAAGFFESYELDAKTGLVVCTGYKMPTDETGEPWHDEKGAEYQGRPEAYSMKARLIDQHGLPEEDVVAESDSIDTITNLVYSQAYFPDERPVGIVAQEAQLERILGKLAPRIMRRPFVGIVAPEAPGQVDTYPLGVSLASQLILLGLKPDNPKIAEITERRVRSIYAGLMVADTLRNRLAELTLTGGKDT